MITPDYLKKGDRIALVAPAGKIDNKIVDSAKQRLERWGLEVTLGKHLFNAFFQYSANDQERLQDFQFALDDSSVRAILCARGGYGTIRIIDRLNFHNFRRHRKWIIGFSDITVLHAHIHNRLGIETIHGTMAGGLADDNTTSDSLRTILFGETLNYQIKTHELSIPGKINGQLIGGNLAILAGLQGSQSDFNTKSKVLFIEEIGENLYRIDRMMWSLKRAGKLNDLAGMVVGSMTEIPDTRDDFGKTAFEIVHEHVKDYNYPVCFNFPAGHQTDNRALIFGRTISMDIDTNVVSLKFAPA